MTDNLEIRKIRLTTTLTTEEIGLLDEIRKPATRSAYVAEAVRHYLNAKIAAEANDFRRILYEERITYSEERVVARSLKMRKAIAEQFPYLAAAIERLVQGELPLPPNGSK